MLSRCLTLLLGTLACGCVHQRFTENFGESFDSVRDDQQNLAGTRSASSEPLTWKQATALLKSRNLTYQRSLLRLDEIKGDQKHFVWRQLNPRILALANLNTTLGTLSSVTDDGLGFNLLGTVNLPDPVSLYAQRYALELRYYQALLDHELLERRLHASLYGFFLQQRQLDQPDFNAPSRGESDNVTRAIERRVNQLRSDSSDKSRRANLRVGVNRLLDTPGSHWRPRPETLPKISYAHRMGKLDAGKGYGRLALWQMAGQVEFARARLTRVELSRLPILSNAVTFPTLYNSRDGQSFDVDNVGLFASLSRSVEFTGRRERSRDQAKQLSDQTRRELRQRLEAEMVLLERLKEDYRLLNLEEGKLESQLKWLKNHPPQGRSDQVLSHVGDLQKLRERLDEVALRKHRHELQFWIWDDSHWGSPF